MIGFSLTLGDERAMWALAFVLRARLTSEQRRFLGAAAMLALDDAEYERTINYLENPE